MKKILAIGNSFSRNACRHVHQIAASGGVELTVVNLYIGGCSLARHWENVEQDAVAYEKQVNGQDGCGQVSIRQMLEAEEWDVITLQQVSQDSGKPETYYPYIEQLARYVRERQPNAAFMIHQTWAYEVGYERLSIYHDSQQEMFDSLRAAYREASVRVGKLVNADGVPLRIIPCGEAFQKARQNPLFQSRFGVEQEVRLNVDGFHATDDYGCYLLGAVWYETLSGRKAADTTYCPEGMAHRELLQKYAHEAVIEYSK